MKNLYLQKQLDNVIWSAVQRARMVNHELNKIQQLEIAGLSSSTPNDSHNRDSITQDLCHTDDKKDMNPDESIVVKMKLNIASPEE